MTGSLVVCSNTSQGRLNWAPIARCVVAHRPQVVHLLASSENDEVTLDDLPEALQRYLLEKGIRFESAFLPSSMNYCSEVCFDVLPGATFRHVEVLEAFHEMNIEISVWATRTDASGRTRLDEASPSTLESAVNPHESARLLLALSGVQIDPMSDVDTTYDSSWIGDALHRDGRGMTSLVLDAFPFDAQSMTYQTPLGPIDARIGEGFWLEDVVAQGIRKYTDGPVWSSAIVSSVPNKQRSLGRVMKNARKRPWRVFVARQTGMDPALDPSSGTSSLLQTDPRLSSVPDSLVRDMRQASGRNELDIVTFGPDELIVHEVKFKRPTEHDVAKLSGIVSRLAPVHRRGVLYHAYAPVDEEEQLEFDQLVKEWRKLFPTITVLHWAVLFGLNPLHVPYHWSKRKHSVQIDEPRHNSEAFPWRISLALLERIWDQDPQSLQCFIEARKGNVGGPEAWVLVDRLAPDSIIEVIQTHVDAVLDEHGLDMPTKVILVRR